MAAVRMARSSRAQPIMALQMVTQQFAHLAGLVVMIHHQLPARPADGASPALPLVHGVVVFEGDTVANSQVSVTDALWIFLAVFAPLSQAALFAHWFYAVQTDSMLVKLGKRLVDTTFGADAPFGPGVTGMVAQLCSEALFTDAPKAGDAALSHGVEFAVGLLDATFRASAEQFRPPTKKLCSRPNAQKKSATTALLP